ncbi:MAG: [FeFe] hydrogenase H-cluster radical SAM maturase HydG [Spirochaetales bacterium]|nr:[FeFe] hydrogenase H-cluster radical SAM maturase HydG [Spirochaetales bacterium]
MRQKMKDWKQEIIKEDEITKYLVHGDDFIREDVIIDLLECHRNPERSYIEEIIAKALMIERLEPEETAALLHVKDPELREEIFSTAAKIKNKVYDNRIVTFAPLYVSNLCVNNCIYCGFRNDNHNEVRRILSQDEISGEVKNILKTGHKRIILVSGEHPQSGADYLARAMTSIYDTQIIRQGHASGIRRINVNAAPMCIADLKKIKDAGIGTYQVFQETYHHGIYAKVHPGTIKSHYRWRLYALHRSMDAGIDDVAIGVLFGLYDWRFDVMGLLYHAIELEQRYGIGPHTVSFPRLNPAQGSPYSQQSRYKVTDADFKNLVAVLRLSIPYTGMILTARESEEVRREVLPLGCTQADASTKIGIGSYSDKDAGKKKQQFCLADLRSLDEMIKELARKEIITSFCTAGYRCGRTGGKIMGMLKSGHEGKFCKLNAVLTFKEWIEDFGDDEMKQIGDNLIQKEFKEIESDTFYKKTKLIKIMKEYYTRIENGERDLYI